MKKNLFITNRLLPVACCLFLTIGTVFAKESTSVAYVDIAYILKNLPQYESAEEQLSLITRRWQKEVDAIEQEAKVLEANYQTEQIFLSDAMRQQREQEILDKENQALELKHKYFGPQGELDKKREALIKPIQDEIFAAIQDIASEQKLNIVKDRSSDPSLIYISAKMDISDEVLHKLGAK